MSLLPKDLRVQVRKPVPGTPRAKTADSARHEDRHRQVVTVQNRQGRSQNHREQPKGLTDQQAGVGQKRGLNG